ncbi:MAG: hypothetical protein KF902_06445 [Phycisphaeraceae bacterium]|nr:hypothetical protein [Phycisphaeraceae bacterium]MCW5769170.1 hypothetical protein [Phycisphaeraceae bacterium]
MNFAKDILSPRSLAGALVVAACSSSALAQDKIDGTRKWSWGENIGWMNWRDAGVHGVRVHDGFLSGRIWSENVGWISLGNGTPAAAGGASYGNTDGSDYGVNIASNGDLSGFAWGENIGWINFSMFDHLGAMGKHARLNLSTRRFQGYAWGENVGWINLDDSGNFVALRCAADYNDDGISDIVDFLDFMDDFAACDGNGMPCGQWGDPDLMPDQFVDIVDFLEFMQVFAEGCA